MKTPQLGRVRYRKNRDGSSSYSVDIYRGGRWRVIHDDVCPPETKYLRENLQTAIDAIITEATK